MHQRWLAWQKQCHPLYRTVAQRPLPPRLTTRSRSRNHWGEREPRSLGSGWGAWQSDDKLSPSWHSGGPVCRQIGFGLVPPGVEEAQNCQPGLNLPAGRQAWIEAQSLHSLPRHRGVTQHDAKPMLSIRASVVLVKLHCQVKVCTKLSDCLSIVHCAVTKK